MVRLEEDKMNIFQRHFLPFFAQLHIQRLLILSSDFAIKLEKGPFQAVTQKWLFLKSKQQAETTNCFLD